jgi:hypothetical protein
MEKMEQTKLIYSIAWGMIIKVRNL